jgi:membrane associated rhomboid family serine protease
LTANQFVDIVACMPPTYTYKSEQSIDPPPPLVTVILVLLCIWAFFDASSHGVGGGHALLFLRAHGFSGAQFYYLTLQGSWDRVAGMLFSATFAQANLWQMLGSIYFIWVFGSAVESRLGAIRFLPLVIVSTVLSWWILGNEVKSVSPFFIGPGLMIAAIIGMYLNFFPVKKINPGGQLKSYRLFKDQKDPNPAEAFGISPWWLIVAFVAFEVGMNFMLSSLSIKFSTMTIMSGFAAMLSGFILSFLLVVAATGKIQGNPLKSLAVQRYQQMRKLDMTHDQAIVAVSRLLSVPQEQVKQWVSQGGGPLPQA